MAPGLTDPTLRRRLAWSIVSGAIAAPLFVALRGLPWRFALVLGVAVGIFTWVTLRTGDRLRDVYRR
jgi:hypothetical protein